MTAVNDPPVAVNDSYTATEDVVLTVATPGVLANDTDIDSSTLTAVVVTGPAHGTLTLAATGGFTYAPAANFNGNDSFTYRANDGALNSNVATVAIAVTAVNDAPVAVNDSATTPEDTTATISVLANDTDVDGDTLSVTAVSVPLHGGTAINPDGTVAYTPSSNYNGADTFTYTISDGHGGTATGTVSVTVTPVNDAPVAAPDTATTAEDTAVTIAVLANDLDIDGDPLTVTAVGAPAHGSAVVDAGGTVTYTPAANYNGVDTLTYTVSDGRGGLATGTVTITITAVNDAPSAVSDSYSTNEDEPLTIAAPRCWTNDTDVDSPALTATVVSTTAHGTLLLNADGSFTYTPVTPVANFNGSDSFTYKANDGTIDSAVASVTITVNGVNDAPAAIPDAYAATEDQPLVIVAPGVLANDTDVDSGALTAVQVTGPANGTLTLNANGSFTYTPAANFNGTDSFTYKANDGTTDSSPATVTITVAAVNDVPVAVNDNYAMNEDGMLGIVAPGVLANDNDVEGSPLSAVVGGRSGARRADLQCRRQFQLRAERQFQRRRQLHI